MDGLEPVPHPSTCFVAVLNSKREEPQLRLLIASLRTFGGKLRDCPVWVFAPGGEGPGRLPGIEGVDLIPLEIEEPYRRYELADKVFACARAEELAGPEIGSLVWVNLDCLIVNPPVLFDLAPAFDAALRPVHLRNVGSPAQAPLDDYWKTVYQTIGVKDDLPYTVEPFVDGQEIRPYFNTHCFAIRPARGILRAWREAFKALVTNPDFQAGPCLDGLHQVFLHQVVLSGLIMKSIERARICMLPPEYSYPLHLQERIPPSRRAQVLNDLVCAVYEEGDHLNNIEIREPLTTWLSAHRNR